jgi:hypothetical protein
MEIFFENAKQAYRRFVPARAKLLLSMLLSRKLYRLRTDVIRYLENSPDQSAEVADVLEYLKANPLQLPGFPSYALRAYDRLVPKVCSSPSGNKYVLYENKKMYFPKNWPTVKIQNYYTDLLREQDVNSPHRYETDSFAVKDGDLVADIGAAEGIFALSIIERAAHIFLFECDENWIAALRLTFEPWQNKITIINKYVSDSNEGNNITIDEFVGGGGIA